MNKSNIDFLTFNNYKLAINILSNKILFRSDNKVLIDRLIDEYNDYPTVWVLEFDNILKLQNILNDFDMSIRNMGPIFVPNNNFEKLEASYKLTRIERKDFKSFKDITNFCFTFDDGYYKDIDALAFYDDNNLIGLTAVNVNSKYLWEFGVEKFCLDKSYKNLMPILVNHLAYRVIKNNPDITPIYSTQFSHIRSINLANRANFCMAMTFIIAN